MTASTTADGVDATRAIGVLLGVSLLATALVAGSVWVWLPAQPEHPVPEAGFTWETVGDVLVATHDGGDAIPASQLSVVGEDITNAGDPLTESEQFRDNETVSQGTYVIIGTGHYAWTAEPPRRPVRIVWHARDGSNVATLGRSHPPGEPPGDGQ